MQSVITFRNIATGIKSLMVHKLRSLLTMLGVVFGVGSVVAMLAVGEGASKEAMERIGRLGSRNIIIRAQKPTEDTAAASTGRSFMSVYGLLYQDEWRVRDGFPDVTRIVPAKVVRKDGRVGTRAVELRVVGTTPSWFQLVPRPLVAGTRTIEQSDMDDRRAVVVLTEQGARKLLATDNTIGKNVRIGGDVYEVISIIQSEDVAAGGMQTPDKGLDAYIPLNVARERYGDQQYIRSSGSRSLEKVELDMMIVEVADEELVESTANAIELMLRRFHKKKDYQMDVPLALLREAERTKRTFNIVLGSIAGISLLVGGIGIMNIMLATVTERTREIGIRRAIGARRKQIVGQFLIETVVLTTLGGVVGVVLGLLIPLGIEHFFDMPTEVPLYAVGLSLGISMAVGIIFGLYPAARAANVDPIVALRHE